MPRSIATLIVVLSLVQSTRSLSATDDEVQTLADGLWALDGNRVDIDLDYQTKLPYNDHTDRSPKKLFKSVPDASLQRGTYASLVSLYPHFNEQSGVTETTSSAKNAAVDAFVHGVAQSKLIRYLRQFLAAKGFKEADSHKSFEKWMKDFWFSTYSRAKGRKDTSAFEHVFMNELKANRVSGLHSWVRLNFLENIGRLDYAGWSKKRKYVSSVQFRVDQRNKGSSFFVGTSPEFDLAVYTACFLLKPGKNACRFQMPDCSDVQVTTWPETQGGHTFMGSAYADAKGRAPSASCRRKLSTPTVVGGGGGGAKGGSTGSAAPLGTVGVQCVWMVMMLSVLAVVSLWAV